MSHTWSHTVLRGPQRSTGCGFASGSPTSHRNIPNSEPETINGNTPCTVPMATRRIF
uniref:Uncharacterized protein n=1 Tax=Anguilla anguilla TaxID=7936 RepID=A0A0E9W8T9_ANGAN